MKPGIKVLVAGGIVVLGLTAGATTYSLWNDPATSAVGAIESGNLDLETTGATTWTETSTDVDAAPHPIDPAIFLATPGDTFKITQEFTTTLEGENMLGKISTSWSSPQDQDLPAGVSATYKLTSPGKPSTAPVALGTSTSVTNLPVGNAVWTVEVSLTFAATKADRFTDPVELAKLGTIVVDLDQVRTGTGFTS